MACCRGTVALLSSWPMRESHNFPDCCCAEAITQSLKSLKALDKTFSITSSEGEGPGQDFEKWEELLSALS